MSKSQRNEQSKVLALKSVSRLWLLELKKSKFDLMSIIKTNFAVEVFRAEILLSWNFL